MISRLSFIKSGLALVLLFSFGVFYSNNNVSAAEAEVLTPVVYEKYLQELIDNGDIGAKETLDKFKNLEKDKQKTFTKFLASPDYFDAFQSAISGERELIYNVDGTEVKVEVKEEGLANKNDSQFSLAATQTSASHSIYLALFGIETSTLTLTVNWEHNGSVAVTPLRVSQGHINRNPAFILTEQSNNSPGYISGGYYYGGGKWRMYATGAAGGISDTISIDIRGTTPQNKYYSQSSTHSGISNISWTKF